MIPVAGQPILTAGAMRAAEDAAIASGTSVGTLMNRAGLGIAAAARRLTAQADILIMCGPGNNGGDGYVAATLLRAAGISVRVAAIGDPKSDAARDARSRWNGDIEPLDEAQPASILIDCLFGTGLTRPLSGALNARLAHLARSSRLILAVDLPSGTDADTGETPDWANATPATVTLALGALKPAHVLHPGNAACGTVRLIDLGLRVPDDVLVAAHPILPRPGPRSHKYTRGMVAIIAGEMEGAARLAATAAMRSGAGYVALYGGSGQGGADAIVRRAYDPDALSDPRIGAILIGPGLGRDDRARSRLTAIVEADRHPLVIDGDALHLLDPDALRRRHHPVVLTPHAGEFRALFGTVEGSVIDQARTAAARSGAIIVLKGPTTIVAGGAQVRVHPAGNPWLSTAGTGDVLAGTIAAQLAHPGADPLAAASAGTWLHARAAALCGKSFIADDLANALTPATAGA